MNRDGHRAGRDTAEHEAAHAVIAVLSGLAVGRVSIAIPKAHRGRMTGYTELMYPAEQWHIPLRPGASLDVAAAGFAWQMLTLGPRDLLDPLDIRFVWANAWAQATGDRRPWLRRHFLGAAARVALVLRRPDTRAAVHEVADLLMARKSGEIYGTTVEKVCRRRGLLPANLLDER